jgi:chondroitin AC lyase
VRNWILILAILVATPVLAAQNDLAIIGQRLRDDLITQRIYAMLIYPSRVEYDAYSRDSVGKWMNTIRKDGTWPDLDYANKRRSDWPLKAHTARTALMAIEYSSPKAKLHGDSKLRDKIVLAYDFWVTNDLTCPNWYPNKISVPANLAATALLMKGELSKKQLDAGLTIISRAVARGTGSNLAEMALIQVGWGCITGDEAVVRSAFDKVAADLKPRKADGIQPDNSYHYHGTQLYSGQYGAVYAAKIVSLIRLGQGTSFALPPDKIALFSNYVLDGQRWMVYGRRLDYGVVGRGITIPEANRRFVPERLEMAMRAMSKMESDRQAEYASYADELGGKKSSLIGNRFFWSSLFMVHRRPGWYSSVRMCSNEVDNADTANGEGLRTHYTADGMLLVMRTGQEYDGIFPVWDWRRVPGTTVEQSAVPLSGSPRMKGPNGFVGGVSDGDYGATAFDTQRGGLSAKKAWLFFDKEIVCLGTDINCDSGNPVLTSVNQCLSRGKAEGPGWVVHDGIGYLFPGQQKVVLQDCEQKGSWHLINENMPDEPVSRKVFSQWLDHGRSPSEAGYEYIVIPGISVDEMAVYAKSDSIRILSNTPEIQAVAKLGVVQAIFRQPGSLTLGDGRTLAVDAACLVLLTDKRISVAGRAHSGNVGQVTVTLSGHDPLVFQLPQGDLAGETITCSP